ncbi:MAG: hypothetical protein ACTSRP_02155 [Candidatus Helarchaeota archaeon]
MRITKIGNLTDQPDKTLYQINLWGIELEVAVDYDNLGIEIATFNIGNTDIMDIFCAMKDLNITDCIIEI